MVLNKKKLPSGKKKRKRYYSFRAEVPKLIQSQNSFFEAKVSCGAPRILRQAISVYV